MVQVTSRERVDAFWSRTLGVDAAHFHAVGVHVFANPPQRATWQGIYVLAFEKSACVFAPPELLETISAVIGDAEIDALVEPETWQKMAELTLRSALGPVVHHYLDDPDGLPELASGRRINPGDTDAIAELRKTVPAQEWAAAGFTDQPAVLFGIFDGDRMMAAANLTSGPDAATDIGIVLRPEARGKGYGVQLAATAARQAIVMHGIARFRILATSQPTMAIAATLGFEAYGRNLTAYLR
jgi:GNAT superfamily N-acetyltransferase